MTKKFNVIYADPPWSYKDKCNSGKRGVEFKYSCMSPQEISDLDVPSISAEDCVLFLWSTMPQLPVAIEVMKNWGFEYKTVAFVWVKINKRAGTPFWGMGNWTRANAEIVLMGVRGKPKRVSKSVHSIVMAPLGKHSVKPSEVRDRIGLLMGDLPSCELFAREKIVGWEAWGDEVECDFELNTR